MKLHATLAFAVLLCSSLPVCADWIATGNVGVIDESALSIYQANGFSLSYSTTTTSTGNIVARYLVTQVGSNFSTWSQISMGFFDNDSAVFLRAKLERYDTLTDQLVAIAYVDSVDNVSVVSTSIPPVYLPLDFTRYSYFFEVQLTRSITTQAPILKYVRIY